MNIKRKFQWAVSLEKTLDVWQSAIISGALPPILIQVSRSLPSHIGFGTFVSSLQILLFRLEVCLCNHVVASCLLQRFLQSKLTSCFIANIGNYANDARNLVFKMLLPRFLPKFDFKLLKCCLEVMDLVASSPCPLSLLSTLSLHIRPLLRGGFVLSCRDFWMHCWEWCNERTEEEIMGEDRRKWWRARAMETGCVGWWVGRWFV